MKTINTLKCYTCPFYGYWEDSMDHHVCKLALHLEMHKHQIEKPGAIPDWCPLPVQVVKSEWLQRAGGADE